jgi:HAD superfamily hydrolase (TIGR01509 family)
VNLRHCRAFVFDMDGTLTCAVHDFDAIRRSLALPVGLPILESLAVLPEAEATYKRQQLEVIELELAKTAKASDGASQFLESLSRRGIRLGIVTRNSYDNAVVTLRAAGLLKYFPRECVSTRDNGKPKPDPDGLVRLIELFGHRPSEVAMVGDYLFDLECGRRAGARTVHYAADDSRSWPEVTDLRVRSFAELAPYLE